MSIEQEKTDAIEQLISFVRAELDSGKTKNEVIKELTDTVGIEKDIATDLVNKVSTYKDVQVSSDSGGSRFIKSVLSLIVMFLILNGVLWFGQELYYMNDIKECEKMEVRLNELKKDASDIETMVKHRKMEQDKIVQLQKDIENGLSKDIYTYDNLVKKYNSELETYKNKMDNYDSIITEHNELARKYNELAKDAYSRWWLLPIPIPGGHHLNVH